MKTIGTLKSALVGLALVSLSACDSASPTANANATAASSQMGAVSCQVRQAPIESEAVAAGDPGVGESAEHSFEFAGFHLGDRLVQAEHTIQQKYPKFSVIRSECEGSKIFMHVGNKTRADGAAVCDVRGESECELLDPAFTAAGAKTPSLSSFHYARNFGKAGKPSSDVLAELELALGKPFWIRSIARNKSWPDIPQETDMLWTNNAEAFAGQFIGEAHAETIVNALPPAQYIEVRLLHRADLNTTYAMNVEMYTRSKSLAVKSTVTGK